MVRTSFSVLVVLLGLSGCISIPKEWVALPIKPDEVRNAVECELAYVFLDPSIDASVIARGTAAVQLTIGETDQRVMAPGLAGSAKIGAISLSASADASASITGTRSITLPFNVLTIGETGNAKCPSPDSPAAAIGLGLADWLKRVAIALTGATAMSDVTEMQFSAAFTLSRSVGGGVVFEVPGLKVSMAGNKVSGSNTSTLVIKFKIPKPAAPPISTRQRQATADELQRELTEERNEPLVVQVVPGQTVTIQ